MRIVQANIATVTIDGQPQDRDADLDHQKQFEVETDSGIRYIVTCEGPPEGLPSDWEVTRRDDGRVLGHVGRIDTGWPGSYSYRFKKAGAFFAGGTQMDLWNAVQSLME
ncbi:hypothetical protein DEJ32_10030 [Curtobacterium sp. MCPF17_046]|nr:hypothetical protein DEJ32_10030 [Curtobacterium sp. MCPF17_046]